MEEERDNSIGDWRVLAARSGDDPLPESKSGRGVEQQLALSRRNQVSGKLLFQQVALCEEIL